MNETTTKRILITQSDLSICSRVVECRFREPDAEADRMRVMRELLTAGQGLEQAVRRHTHCALVNHSGSYGSVDFSAATQTLFNAMFRYAAVVREVAAHFGGGARIDEEPAQLEVQ